MWTSDMWTSVDIWKVSTNKVTVDILTNQILVGGKHCFQGINKVLVDPLTYSLFDLLKPTIQEVKK